MDAGESSKPRTLAEIGRSGTFVIEPAAENEVENEVVEEKQLQDEQKTSVGAEVQKEQSQSLQDTIELRSDNDGRSLEIKTTNNRTGPEEADSNNSTEKSLDNDNKGRGGQRRRTGILKRNVKGGSLDTSSNGVPGTRSKGRSLDTGTEYGRVEWLDIASKNSALSDSATAETLGDFAGTRKEELLDAVTETDKSGRAKSGGEKTQDEKGGDNVATEKGRGESPVAAKTDKQDLSDQTKTEELEPNDKRKQESADLENIRREPLDLIESGNEESLVVTSPKEEKGTTITEDKTESTTTQNDQQDDDNNAEAATEEASTEREIADPSISSDEAFDKKCEDIVEEHTDQEVVTAPPKLASLSSSRSSLDADKELPVPVPAPRKSVSKVRDEKEERYSDLRAKFRQRWESVANIPKFQNFDRKTRELLQEQADRRLGAVYPPFYNDDFKMLLVTIEKALERFYDESQEKNDRKAGGQGLPSLRFLQWILPALDGETRKLLFRCDIYYSDVK